MPFRQATIGISLDMIEVVDDEPARGPIRSDILQNLPLSVKRLFGTSGGQANKGYFRKETLTAGQTVTRDLNGVLTDRDGSTIDLDLLDYLVVVNFSTIDTVSIGPLGAANPVAGLTVSATGGAICGKARTAKDPGVLCWSIPAGLTITAATADEIQLINNDGANSTVIYWGFVGRDTP